MKQRVFFLIATILPLLTMSYIDAVLQPDYVYKTLFKIVMFVGIPILYSVFERRSVKLPANTAANEKPLNLGIGQIKSLFKWNSKHIVIPLTLGISACFIIIILYLIFRKYFPFNGIVPALQSANSITRTNYIFVALYMTFGNSFLEEFYFRGFCYSKFLSHTSSKTASIYSSAVFALYHAAIFYTWLDPILTTIMLI